MNTDLLFKNGLDFFFNRATIFGLKTSNRSMLRKKSFLFECQPQTFQF